METSTKIDAPSQDTDPPEAPPAGDAAAVSAAPAEEAPFQLRGNAFTMMVLRVLRPDTPGFFKALEEKIVQAPNFFRNAPVVVDLEDVGSDRSFHLPGFVRRLRSLHLVPVGVQGGTAEQHDAASTLGMALLPPTRSGRRDQGGADAIAASLERLEAAAAAAPPQPPPESPKRPPALVLTEPVRSGRQVYAEHGNLVVLSSVSPGAEILADGDIYVYGALRGRALAGLSGDRNARIICLGLEAEMVSIAGLYRVSEDIDETIRKKPVHIYLQDGCLHITPL